MRFSKGLPPHVTRVGRILHKMRVDELPQVINVLMGEMSMVGPRPEWPQFIEKLQKQIPFYRTRLAAKQEGLNPNVLAGSLLPALFVPLGLAIGLCDGSQPRALLTLSLFILLTVVLIAVITLSQSRGSYLGLAFGCFVLIALRFPRLLWMLPVVVIIVLIAREPISAYVSQLNWDALSSGRYVFWQRAWYLVQDFLFTSTGLNIFAPASQILYSDLPGDDLTLIHAHNMFLQLVLDFGVFGLVASVWLMVRVWLAGLTRIRDPHALPSMQWVLRGLLAGQAAWLEFNLTDYANLGSKQGFLFWAAWGLIIAFSANHCVMSKSYSGPGRNATVLPSEGGGFNSNGRP